MIPMNTTIRIYSQNFEPMDETERRLPSHSSFLKRRHHELSNYLINEMGFEAVLAHTVLKLHQPATLREVTQFRCRH